MKNRLPKNAEKSKRKANRMARETFDRKAGPHDNKTKEKDKKKCRQKIRLIDIDAEDYEN